MESHTSARSLKARIREGGPVLGSWLSLPSAAIAEIVADAGFAFVTVDLEHSTLTLADAEVLIRAIERCGVAPLVRLSGQDATQAARVMDAGAHGVIVPRVNTAAEAEAMLRAIHYPPEGTRGVGLGRASRYGEAFDEYRTWLDESCVFIPQIEHEEAVANIDAILAVDGIDACLLGPYDLSASLGVPGQLEHERVQEAQKRVREAAERADVPVGLHLVEPDPSRLPALLAEGFRLLVYSVDFRMIAASCRAAVEAVR